MLTHFHGFFLCFLLWLSPFRPSLIQAGESPWTPAPEFGNAACANPRDIRIVPRKFLRLVKERAARHDPWAERCLGTLYLTGDADTGVPKNPETAASLLKSSFVTSRRLAEKGDTAGMWLWGDSLCSRDYANFLQQDRAAGMKWLKLASERGYARAQVALATQLNDEPYVQVEWWRLAAMQGDNDAQANLGVCLVSGTVHCRMNLKDSSLSAGERARLNAQRWLEGMSWLRKAADQGNRSAIARLAISYRQEVPIELPIDLVESYKWNTVLIRRGGSQPLRDHAQKLLTSLASHQMSAAQVRDGESRATAFLRGLDEGVPDPSPVVRVPPDALLPKFVDELPHPTRLVIPKNQSELVVRLRQFNHRFHRDLPPTPVWGYEGQTPGPTIEVEKGQKLHILWKNELPNRHLLPMQKTTSPEMAMMIHADDPEARAVTHLHGAIVTQPSRTDRERNNDGWPEAWTRPGQTQTAEYPNQQDARTLWYHDHAMGITGRNVYAGLEGFYLIHDEFERELGLPAAEFDVPLMIQSRSFNADGTLLYPQGMAAEVYGDTITVNGKIWPYLEVEPRKYRLRILNASNAREVSLKLLRSGEPASADDGKPGPAFQQIASDGGFLEKAVTLNDPRDPQAPRLNLAAAERAEVIVDFSGEGGKQFRLDNSAMPDEPELGRAIPDVMLFRVKAKPTSPDLARTPERIRSIPRLQPEQAVTVRKIVLGSETDYPDGTQMLLLNGKHWADPITEKPVLGTTEIWEILNTTQNSHPFHLHLVQFQVLDRRPWDVGKYRHDGSIQFTGPAILPPAPELGWKDTVKAAAGEITRIIMKFEPCTGFYVYHCHILEHEDMDMMRPFEVIAP